MSPIQQTLSFSSSISKNPDWLPMVQELCQDYARQTRETPPTLAILFLTTHYLDHTEQIAEQIMQTVNPSHLAGCSAEGVVCGEREVEDGPAASLWLGWLPGVDVTTVRLSLEQTSDGPAIVGWPEQFGDAWPETASMLLLANPFSFPADYFLQSLAQEHPQTLVLGGMASGGFTPGENRVFSSDGKNIDAVGVFLSTNHQLTVTPVVSQGCRPIGERMIVTGVERNTLLELGGKPALQQLKRVFDELPNGDKELVRRGIHVGVAHTEHKAELEAGDFLIRNVAGIDSEKMSVQITDFVKIGRSIQFHLRDENSAHADLTDLLAAVPDDLRPQGALLFTCNGRGTRLFSEADHDTRAIRKRFGDIPLAGFFAQGEIGPIAGKNYLHGFTASVVLFHGPSSGPT